MKAGLLAALLFNLYLYPTFAVEKRHDYGHLPLHVRGTLQGRQTHEDVFYGRAGQHVLIKTRSSRMKWLVASVTPVAAKAPIFNSIEGRAINSEITLPHDGAYLLRVAVRPDRARLGYRVNFYIDIIAASHLAGGTLAPGASGRWFILQQHAQ